MHNLQQDLFRPNIETVLSRIANLTKQCSQAIPTDHKVKYSQYFTESSVAKQMAGMLKVANVISIGDHGAGTGILGATVLAHALNDRTGSSLPLSLRAYEIDDFLHETFMECLGEVCEFAKSKALHPPAITLKGDFTELAPSICRGNYTQFLDLIILNPPYQKLNQKSELAQLLKKHLVPTPNLYAVFIALSVMMLRPRGQLVAIVPRSFTNGVYFKPFRKWLMANGSIDWFVRYKRRSNVFRGDNVLQENIVFRFSKAVDQAQRVRVSLCDSPECPPIFESMIPARDVFPEESDTINVPAHPDELNALHRMRAMPYGITDLGLTIATGKLEDFRMREHLHDTQPKDSWAPVIYSQHWERGSIALNWSQVTHNNKPACLDVNSVTKRKLLPRGNYVLVKRISANDDRSGRCNPCVLTVDSAIPGEYWAIDNHLQIIQGSKDKPLTAEDARTLAEYLCTEDVDHVLRLVSGTTQLNCADIGQLRFPEYFSVRCG